MKQRTKSIFFNQSILLPVADNVGTFRQWKSSTNKIQHKFKFTRDLSAVCESKEGKRLIDLLVVITSSHGHRDNRQSLRDSWLTYSQNNTSNMRYIFILGETSDIALFQKLIKEAEEYKDIVIANFQDTY